MNEILKKIEEASHIVVLAHASPDADSLGSASALYTQLLRFHKKVTFFCVTENINHSLAFLPWFEKIKHTFPSSADLAISLDCASRERLGINVECALINIDHHGSNTNFGEINLVDTLCISTTEVLYNFFKSNDISINPKMATALYAGLLCDSRGFLNDTLAGTAFACAKELIECGADNKTCNKYLMKYLTLAAFRLKGLMYQNMRLFHDGRISVFCVSNDDILSTGAEEKDCEKVLEESLYLPSVEIALLIRENKDLSIKGSLRSSSEFDVSKIAHKFNGGGHRNRAGFNVDASLSMNEMQKKVLKLIYEEIQIEK
ncbi:bifunctional oligoribonuclease/PAP phosphatase NrnA [bacterium]|nr:bifunctional oligoribonuclease/PAP phosphatase NrnA [bacterium]MBU1994809.1 bifunctional oligoribonuclease/PAP phosphatase NrnA [bacterium]